MTTAPARQSAQACLRCHQQPAQQYQAGVHGTALSAHPQSRAVCVDCHRTHDILSTDDPKSWVLRQRINQTCENCHGDKRFTEQFGLDTLPAVTYHNSYHGIALRHGNLAAATCVDCHNSRDIRRSTDPAACTSVANLTVTCGKCHPGALDGIVRGKVHVTAAPASSWPVLIVPRLYQVLLVASMPGFVACIVLGRGLAPVPRGLEAWGSSRGTFPG